MGRIEADNATMQEVFWFMQNKSQEDAQDLFAFIRKQQDGKLEALVQWLRSKGPQIAFDAQDEEMATHRSSNQSATTTDFDVMQDSDEEPFSKLQIHYGSSVASSSLNARPGAKHDDWIKHATVATVKRAVQMFFDCTGLLFHVYEEDQVDQKVQEALGSITKPEETLFLDVLKQNSSMRITFAELAGMAGVGILYLRTSKETPLFPRGLAQHFYDITRWLLDSAVEQNPLRAMKVCVLLSMYNIALKATVALMYIGESIAQR